MLLACAFFLGVDYQHDKQQAQRITEAQQIAEQTKKSVSVEVQRAQEINQKVVEQIEQERATQIAIRDAAIRRLSSKKAEAERKISELEANGVTRLEVVEVCSGGDLFRLDLGTVRLFDAARTGVRPPDPAAGVDEESRTLTDIGAGHLIDYGLEVTGKYRQLATRCDALVDWIADKQKQQAQ